MVMVISMLPLRSMKGTSYRLKVEIMRAKRTLQLDFDGDFDACVALHEGHLLSIESCVHAGKTKIRT
ncbi:hypothetical protein [Tumebacillus lipolyticus]|uniref:Uncharacterized protein n=1 Tax=Tumebacillus lipolyticus TaxID=1280370 RepID=A0ABW5A1R7_9BACL